LQRRWLAPLALTFIAILAAAGLWHRALRAQRPESAAKTHIAALSGLADQGKSSPACVETGDRAGIGGWRRGATCFRREPGWFASASRDARNRLVHATTRWYRLSPAWMATLSDSIDATLVGRGADRIQCRATHPENLRAEVAVRGAWQGRRFQALLIEYSSRTDGPLLQLEITSSRFSLCEPSRHGAA
jgi:hypothetical protein